MQIKANGTFEVELTPVTIEESFDRDRFAQMSICKQFSGDIEGKGSGQMLSLHGQVDGSASYVAIENISGTLNGKKGSFSVQHSCSMSGSSEQQDLTIVPDSGTDELSGIAGKMQIEVSDDGTHRFNLNYTLDP